MAILSTLYLPVGELHARITDTPASILIDVHGVAPRAEDEDDLYDWIESLFDPYRDDPRPITFLWTGADHTGQVAPAADAALVCCADAPGGWLH